MGVDGGVQSLDPVGFREPLSLNRSWVGEGGRRRCAVSRAVMLPTTALIVDATANLGPSWTWQSVSVTTYYPENP